MPWIEQTLQVQPPRIALLGVSMGGQGVLLKQPSKHGIVRQQNLAVTVQK
ncbi:MAG: hypothetical protein ACKPHU_10685 [Planctomycetaceae bacterium]